MRLALVGLIVVAVGFAAGLSLRLVGDASEVVAPERAKSIDGGPALREVRLLQVDPGLLPTPTPTPAGAPAAPVPPVAVGPIAPPPPAPRAPAPPEPSPAADGGGGFDSPGPDEAPQENTFDSEG